MSDIGEYMERVRSGVFDFRRLGGGKARYCHFGGEPLCIHLHIKKL